MGCHRCLVCTISGAHGQVKEEEVGCGWGATPVFFRRVRKSWWMSELREWRKTRVWKRLIWLGMREGVDRKERGAMSNIGECSMVLLSSQYLFMGWYSFE